MKKEYLQIDGIPAIIWGEKTNKVVLAIHGLMSSKDDAPIKLLAELAGEKQYGVLSFDLPEHGQRISSPTPLTISNGIKDLSTVMTFAKKRWTQTSLFAVSLGAYLSLCAYKNENFAKILFLSPIVDMQGLIFNMMKGFNITQTDLKNQKIITLPTNQKMYYEDFCFATTTTVECSSQPYVLYGQNDELCPQKAIDDFCKKHNGNLTVVPNSAHYFCLPKQLNALYDWLNTNL